MAFWLLKTEPQDYSWSNMVSDVSTSWDGVKNHQALAYMRQASVGDLAFFYHTGKDKAIMGVVKVTREFYVSENSDEFGCIDVECFYPLSRRVSLEEIKRNPSLNSMTILKQPRLSVSSITPEEWNLIIDMSNS